MSVWCCLSQIPYSRFYFVYTAKQYNKWNWEACKDIDFELYRRVGRETDDRDDT